MGNLLCCWNTDRSFDEYLQRPAIRSINSVIKNAQTQPNFGDTTVPVNPESCVTVTNLPSPGPVPPMGNINPLQRNLQTKLHPRKATGLVAVEKVNMVHSKPAFSKPQRVAHNMAETQTCKACGEIGHLTESCRYFTRLCFHCREEGHINRICPKRKRHGIKQKENRTQQKGTNQVAGREQKHKLLHKQHGTKVQKRTKSIKN